MGRFYHSYEAVVTDLMKIYSQKKKYHRRAFEFSATTRDKAANLANTATRRDVVSVNVNCNLQIRVTSTFSIFNLAHGCGVFIGRFDYHG